MKTKDQKRKEAKEREDNYKWENSKAKRVGSMTEDQWKKRGLNHENQMQSM